MKNKLPQYWIVKSDCSQLFYDTVIEYINEISSPESYGGDYLQYYGVDGNRHAKGGICFDYDKRNFINNPVELTIQEFIKLTKTFTFGR